MQSVTGYLHWNVYLKHIRCSTKSNVIGMFNYLNTLAGIYEERHTHNAYVI